MIINVTVYIATIDMVSFYTSARYSSIKIIFKIIIIEVSPITFMFVLIGIAVNNAIHNARRHKFVFPYFKQMVIKLDIFI